MSDPLRFDVCVSAQTPEFVTDDPAAGLCLERELVANIVERSFQVSAIRVWMVHHRRKTGAFEWIAATKSIGFDDLRCRMAAEPSSLGTKFERVPGRHGHRYRPHRPP